MYLTQLKYRTNQGPMSLKYLNTFSTTFQNINSGLKKKKTKKYPMSLGTQLRPF